MADDDKLDSHKHRRKKAGTPEWSETCIGFWSKKHKEIPGKENEEQRRCRGISILHLNQVCFIKWISRQILLGASKVSL